MGKLLFGVSGLPMWAGRKFNYASGIAYLKGLGLDALEMQFGRRINVTDNNREAILASSRANGFRLSAHASYFVNLNAEDATTRQASAERIAAAARAVLQVGGAAVVLHAGLYGSASPEAAYARVRETLAGLPAIGAVYRLETTGKESQFGSLEEVIRLCRDLPGVKPCIDFSHLHARGRGSLRRYEDFARVLDRLGEVLGREALDDMHVHMSGIAYTAKGERSHLPLAESDFNFRDGLRALKDYGVAGCLIGESPIVEKDALLLRRTYEAL